MNPCTRIRFFGGVLARARDGAALPLHRARRADVSAFEAELDAAKARGERVPHSLVLQPGTWIEVEAGGRVAMAEAA